MAMGYDEESISALGVNAKGTGSLLAAHTLIRAHAKAYRLYDKTFRARQKGITDACVRVNDANT